MSAPLYKLNDVRKRHGNGFHLHIEELEIDGSGIFALLGPNGSGKSTLLRLLHFLEPVEAGTIRFRGQTIHFPASLSLRRSIAMVFQKPVMLSGSVRHNILYGMRLRKAVYMDRLDAILRELDLVALADEPAKKLSGGEAQRVALARALVTQPDVLLLDEPTANLDPYNIRLIEHIIKRTAEQGRVNIVLVTHDVFQVRRLADTAAFMVAGKIIETGSIDDFFDRPADHRTRAYLQGELIG